MALPVALAVPLLRRGRGDLSRLFCRRLLLCWVTVPSSGQHALLGDLGDSRVPGGTLGDPRVHPMVSGSMRIPSPDFLSCSQPLGAWIMRGATLHGNPELVLPIAEVGMESKEWGAGDQEVCTASGAK